MKNEDNGATFWVVALTAAGLHGAIFGSNDMWPVPLICAGIIFLISHRST